MSRVVEPGQKRHNHVNPFERRQDLRAVFWAGVPFLSPQNSLLTARVNTPPYAATAKAHFILFRMLNERFLFLNRSQIERVLTQPKSSRKRCLVWLVSEKYLDRRYRADTFLDFQRPLYYLGTRGWRMCGNSAESYKAYRTQIEERHGQHLTHLLSVYDVLLKFVLEADVTRIIGGEDRFWQETLSFGNIPDAWIQYRGGEAFIEVDRGTEPVSVVAKKIDNYIRLKRSGGYSNMFPGCTFRVLFITTTEERIEALQQVTECYDIWFATMQEFLKEPLTHSHWFGLKGIHALPVAPKEEV